MKPKRTGRGRGLRERGLKRRHVAWLVLAGLLLLFVQLYLWVDWKLRVGA